MNHEYFYPDPQLYLRALVVGRLYMNNFGDNFVDRQVWLHPVLLSEPHNQRYKVINFRVRLLQNLEAIRHFEASQRKLLSFQFYIKLV